MGCTSDRQFRLQWTTIFLRWFVTIDDDVSQESIVIFINELGIWVVRVTGNLGCNGRPYFGGGGIIWIMMMFQLNLL